MTNAQIAANAGAFFGTGAGQIGLSMLRLRIPPVQGQWAGTFAPALNAIANGVTQVLSTAWTPPANWKANNAVTNGFAGNVQDPNGYLLPANYANYANYLRDYANAYRTATGVDLYALSPANEPDWYVQYDGCTWSGATLRDFVKNNLGPTFQAAGLPTRLIIPESFRNDCAYADPSMADAAARNYLFGVGMHFYGGGPNACASMNGLGKEFWQTENSNFTAYDASMTHGLLSASWIHNALVNAGYNAFFYWWLGSDANNEGLTTKTLGTPKRFWTFGNYSKFIRPGWNRIDATAAPTGGVTVSAYRNGANNAWVIVAINTGAAVSQQFNLAGISASNFTPYVTSASLNLAAQAAVAVSGGGFSYTLPAMSVTSFVGAGAAGTPTVTPTASPTPFTQLFDDFEDVNTANNWGGAWGIYAGTGSAVTLTVAAPGAPGSALGRAQIAGNITDYGGITATFSGSPRDLSAYVAVQFKVRGTGTFWFQAAQASITDGDHFGLTFTATAGWTTVTLDLADFRQRGFGAATTFDPAQIQYFQWASYSNGAMNYEIDDVQLLTYAASSPTPTPTRTRTATGSPTPSRTATPSSTRSSTASASPSPSATSTPTRTASSTFTPASTFSSTASPSPSRTRTATASASPSATRTPTPTATPTRTSSSSPSATSSATLSVTASGTATAGPSASSTVTPSRTATRSSTATASSSPSSTPTRSSSATPSPTPSITLSATASRTRTPGPSPTSSSSATPSPTPTRTRTASASPSLSATPSLSSTGTGTESRTPSSSPTPSITLSDTASRTLTPGPSPTSTATPTSSPTPSASATPSLTATASSSSSPSATPSATPSQTPTSTPSPSPTASASPSASGTITPGPSPSASETSTSTATPSSTATSTPAASASSTATSTSSSSATATPAASATSSPTAPATGTPSATATPSGTPPATGTASATPTSTAAASATLTPISSAPPSPAPSPDVPVEILKAFPLPNPDPLEIALLLNARADKVVVKVWSVNFRLLAVASAGPAGPGWARVPLPLEFLRSAQGGVYHYSVQAFQGDGRSKARLGSFLVRR